MASLEVCGGEEEEERPSPLVRYEAGSSLAGALAVLDGSVLDGAVLSLRVLDEAPASAARAGDAREDETRTKQHHQPGSPLSGGNGGDGTSDDAASARRRAPITQILQKPPSVAAATATPTTPSISSSLRDSSTVWESPLELEWRSDLDVAALEPGADEERSSPSARLVRRAVALTVDSASSFLAAQPARAVREAACAAPALHPRDLAVGALLPQRFTLGGPSHFPPSPRASHTHIFSSDHQEVPFLSRSSRESLSRRRRCLSRDDAASSPRKYRSFQASRLAREHPLRRPQARRGARVCGPTPARSGTSLSSRASWSEPARRARRNSLSRERESGGD